MTPTQLSFPSPADGLPIAVRRWSATDPRAVVQIAHGVAEHGRRYARLAEQLVGAGYEVVVVDHRGHGDSVGQDVRHGSFGAAGWPALVADVVALTELIHETNPGLPVFLLGHSMGSFAAQQVLLDHSRSYAGAIICGSTSLDLFAQGLADAGPDVDLSMFNAGFEHRTGYEWLSRDEHEVDLYVADPLSGFDLAADTIPQLFGSAARLADPAALAQIARDLPLLLISGYADPLAGGGALIVELARRYRAAGVEDVTDILYPGARHELFNETNRDEVTADLLAWLDRHL